MKLSGQAFWTVGFVAAATLAWASPVQSVGGLPVAENHVLGKGTAHSSFFGVIGDCPAPSAACIVLFIVNQEVQCRDQDGLGLAAVDLGAGSAEFRQRTSGCHPVGVSQSFPAGQCSGTPMGTIVCQRPMGGTVSGSSAEESSSTGSKEKAGGHSDSKAGGGHGKGKGGNGRTPMATFTWDANGPYSYHEQYIIGKTFYDFVVVYGEMSRL